MKKPFLLFAGALLVGGLAIHNNRAVAQTPQFAVGSDALDAADLAAANAKKELQTLDVAIVNAAIAWTNVEVTGSNADRTTTGLALLNAVNQRKLFCADKAHEKACAKQ